MDREDFRVRGGQRPVKLGKVSGGGLGSRRKAFGRSEPTVEFVRLDIHTTAIRFAFQRDREGDKVNVKAVHLLGGEVHSPIANNVQVESPLFQRRLSLRTRGFRG